MKKRSRKSKKRGVQGRRWARSDRRPLTPGQRDSSGLLEIVAPDLGTENGHRCALARCLCGCRLENKKVRIDNFLAGTASCPTRRRKHNRDFMERKKHIEMTQLINSLVNGVKLPESATKAAVTYAQELVRRPELKATVRSSFKSDLAERDIKRAAHVVAKYGTAPITEPRSQAPALATMDTKLGLPKEPASIPLPSPAELEWFRRSSSVRELETSGLLDSRGHYTDKGKVWIRALRQAHQAPPEPVKAPEPPLEEKLRVLIPYLDIAYDTVTFGRVPKDMRRIDDKNVRELLVGTEIIDAKLYLTEKGKAWLARS